MALTAVFKYSNSDSTQDLNLRFKSILGRGVLQGGMLTPVAGQLQASLTPLIAVATDGMLVQDTSAHTFTLVAGQTTVCAVNALYVFGGDPTLSYVTYEVSAFNALSNRSEFIVLGAVTLGALDTEIISLSQISYTLRDSCSTLARNSFRGILASSDALPPLQNSFTNNAANPTVITTPVKHYLVNGDKVFITSSTSTPSINGLQTITVVGDYTFSVAVNVIVGGAGNYKQLAVDDVRAGDWYLITAGTGDTPEMRSWNGVSWINMTTVLLVQADLATHRANGFVNEKHLTDNQANAALGSSGAPSLANRFVTEADTRLPSQSENDALQGTYGSPSNTNRYVTATTPYSQPSAISFLLPPGQITITVADGPVFVGLGGAGSANKYFLLEDLSLDRGYLNSLGSAVSVTGVFKDSLLTIPLIPSSDADANGFFTSNVYLQTSTVVDTGLRVLYGKSIGINSLDKGSNLTPAPHNGFVPGDVQQKVANIKGATYDTLLTTRQQNLGLRTAVDNLISYLTSVQETNLVAGDEDYTRLAGDPNLSANFVKNVGIPPVYTFSNSTLSAITYNQNLGRVSYSDLSVNLGSVSIGDVFRDGAGAEFKIAAVDNILKTLDIVSLITGEIPINISSAISTSADASARLNNNPNNLLLSEMRLAGQSEIIPILEIEEIPNSFSKPDGRLSFGVRRRGANRIDPRILLNGGWETFIDPTTALQWVRNTSSEGEILITGFFTRAVLLCDIKPTSPNLSISLDGKNPASTVTPSTSGGLTANNGMLPTGKNYSRIELASGLPSSRPNTVSAKISGAGDLVIYGLELLFEDTYQTALLESGVGFKTTELFTRNTVDLISLTGIGSNLRGGSTLVGGDLSSYVVSNSFLPDIDSGMTANITGAGPYTVTVVANIAKLRNFRVNDLVKIIGPATVEYRLIDSISIATNSFQIVVATTTGTSGPGFFSLVHICSSNLNIPLGTTGEREVARYSLVYNFINDGVMDYSPSLVGPLTRRYAVNADGHTVAAAFNSTIINTGVASSPENGLDKAVQITTAGSGKFAFNVLATRLDLVFVNTVSATANISINGAASFAVTVPVGVIRKTIFFNARYQSHEVVITVSGGGASLNLSKLIVFGPPLATMYQNPLLAGFDYLSQYLSAPTEAMAGSSQYFSQGTAFYDALRHMAFYSGTGVNTDWNVVATDTTALGVNYQTQNDGAAAQFSFIGTCFELHYLEDSNGGIFNITVDGIDLNLAGGTLVGNYSASVGTVPAPGVDSYAVASNKRAVGVKGLTWGYHVVRVSQRTPRDKNVGSANYYMSLYGIVVGNENLTHSLGYAPDNMYSGTADLRKFLSTL